MCIVLVTTSHPRYSLILLSNRDEFLNRPTAPAAWWSSPAASRHKDDASRQDQANGLDQAETAHVLSGRDLRNPAHGTWLGVTRQGRIAVLTNFRDANEDPAASTGSGISGQVHPVDEQKAQAAGAQDARSRGEITTAYLLASAGPREWAKAFVEQMRPDKNGPWANMGGFSLLFGTFSGDDEVTLGILSNRAEKLEDVIWKDAGPRAKQTIGLTCSLSNSHFGDRAWPKVVKGEELLEALVNDDIRQAREGTGSQDEQALLEKCFAILSTSTMPPREEEDKLQDYMYNLRRSIFIPEFATVGELGPYGTQKQTAVLIDKKGKVAYVERTLYGDDAQTIPQGQTDRRFEFKIET